MAHLAVSSDDPVINVEGAIMFPCLRKGDGVISLAIVGMDPLKVCLDSTDRRKVFVHRDAEDMGEIFRTVSALLRHFVPYVVTQFR